MIWTAADLRARERVSVGSFEVVYLFASLAGAPSSTDEALLDAEERDRSSRFVRPTDRSRFVRAHAMLRLFLARCLGVDPRGVRYEHGVDGKPQLPPDLGPLGFNLSHSDELALLAVARCPVGVDVERVRDLPDALSIADMHFTAAERTHLRSLPPADRPLAFFRWWTRKEAVIKATGEGLARGLESFDVGAAAGPATALLRLAGRPGEEAAWWSLRDLPSPSGYAAAGAVAASVDAPPPWRELAVTGEQSG